MCAHQAELSKPKSAVLRTFLAFGPHLFLAPNINGASLFGPKPLTINIRIERKPLFLAHLGFGASYRQEKIVRFSMPFPRSALRIVAVFLFIADQQWIKATLHPGHENIYYTIARVVCHGHAPKKMPSFAWPET